MNTISHLLGSLVILSIWHIFSIGTEAEGLIVIVLINIYWRLTEPETTQSKSKASSEDKNAKS